MSATERHLIVETVLDGRWMPRVEGLAPGSHARVAEHEPSPYLRIFVQDMKIPAVAVVHLTAEDALKFAEQIQFLAAPGREEPIAARPEAAEAVMVERIRIAGIVREFGDLAATTYARDTLHGIADLLLREDDAVTQAVRAGAAAVADARDKENQ